jgi:putative addiction module CopG family antidote
MTIELTPEQQRFVETQIAAGAFNEPRELIDAALELLQSRQREYEQLRTAIDQDRRGEFAELDMDDVKTRGRARRAAKNK